MAPTSSSPTASESSSADATVRFVALPVRISPSVRLRRACDSRRRTSERPGVGAAARASRGLRTRRRPADPRGRSRLDALAAAGLDPAESTDSGGAAPARRSPKVRATRSSRPRSASPTTPVAPSRAARPHAGHRSAARRGRRGRGGLRGRPASWWSPTVVGPGSAPHSRPAAAPVRPRSCSPRGRSRRAHRPGHPLPRPARPLPRRRRVRHPRPLRPAPVPRGDVPAAVREVGEHLAALDARAWSLPDPDGRLGAAVARQVGATLSRRPRSTPRSATPRPRPRCSARSARSTRPAPSRHRHRRRSDHRRHHHRRRTGARRGTSVADVLATGRPAIVRRGAAGPRPAHADRRDDPDGRPARERAVRPRAPRRCCSCSAAAAPTAARSTRRRRSTPRASRAARRSSSRSRSPATASCTPSS